MLLDRLQLHIQSFKITAALTQAMMLLTPFFLPGLVCRVQAGLESLCCIIYEVQTNYVTTLRNQI